MCPLPPSIAQTPAARAAPDAVAPGPRRYNTGTPQTPHPARPVFARNAAPSALLAPSLPDPLNLLANPFRASFAEAAARVAAAGDSLDAHGDNFELPLLDLRKQGKAGCDPNANKWRDGEASKFSLLCNNFKVFHAVNRAAVRAGGKVLGCCFVYRRKKDQHGRVIGHKADVDKAYLHSALDKELCMRIPKGIDNASLAGKVLRLNCVLYWLKQAGRVWNHRIHAILQRLRYRRTTSDACVYVQSKQGHHPYIAFFVDNLLFVSPLTATMDQIEDGLRKGYNIKDLGLAHFACRR
ncbi:uncharacterized protein JCM10292_007108 [Rhodotorula paludigena]|uniref:uncharacterized protein n=1 Tax=Rhodotorula paludigena TaxID=86838 RepID=UPI00317E20DD